MKKYIYFYNTKIGKVGIAEKNDKITNLFFDTNIDLNKYEVNETNNIKNAYLQLDEYLNNKRKTFDINIYYEGSNFQKKVMDELLKINYGQTKSYKDIAILIKSPKACRAVGLICSKNPLPIFIPCHRVIGTNKKLIGYRGGFTIKENLLEIEKKI